MHLEATDPEGWQRLYFLGIGGIGMSALARWFARRGCEIHGYDRTPTPLTRTLEREGMHIHYEENVGKIPAGLDAVIYTPAIPAEHAERRYLLERGLPLLKRAEVLGLLSRKYRTLAVAGTHGKTTTSALLTHLLRSAGVDCSAFLGGIALDFDSNYVEGNSPFLVVEADEYDRSFLHLQPDTAVLTSMDPDHLDIYGTHEEMLESGFRAFLRRVPPQGNIFVHEPLRPLLPGFRFQTFGLETGEFRGRNLRVEGAAMVFDFEAPHLGIHWEGMRFPLPGRHNAQNAVAALAVAGSLGASEEGLRRGLASFRGIKRRFEVVFRSPECVIIDDYAHHPTELQAAIEAARQFFPGKKLTGAFQPHLYTRTRDFASGFARALDALDEIYLLDIYPAREEPLPGVSSRLIFEQMNNPNKQLLSKEQLLDTLKRRPPEVLLTLGAGDIDALVAPIAQWMRQRN
ncbi:MAG: UDP-N-acetylmuramate--L-alanine ligase [Bacteroidetes bacterium]|nr:MAG: UDP-N-acetylmuramate--L-alanine ligase [Bacteroidota bacterium]